MIQIAPGMDLKHSQSSRARLHRHQLARRQHTDSLLPISVADWNHAVLPFQFTVSKALEGGVPRLECHKPRGRTGLSDPGKPESDISIQSDKRLSCSATGLASPPARNRFMMIFPDTLSVLTLVSK